MISDSTRHHERMEIAYCREWCEAATPEVATACGLSFESVAGALVSIVANADVLSLNRVLGVGVEGPATEALIDRLVERYRSAGVGRFFLPVCPESEPPELAEWLTRRGFRLHNNWIKLGRRSEPPTMAESAGGDATEPARVEEIGPDRAADFGRIAGEGFNFPPPVAAWASCLVGRPGFRHYLALDGEKPVGTGAYFRRGEWASFGFAVVLPEARKRGVQRALIERRMRDAAADGCRNFTVETAEDTPEKPAPSFRNLRRLGFEVAYVRPNWIWKAA